jgi:hypothetical protein
MVAPARSLPESPADPRRSAGTRASGRPDGASPSVPPARPPGIYPARRRQRGYQLTLRPATPPPLGSSHQTGFDVDADISPSAGPDGRWSHAGCLSRARRVACMHHDPSRPEKPSPATARTKPFFTLSPQSIHGPGQDRALDSGGGATKQSQSCQNGGLVRAGKPTKQSQHCQNGSIGYMHLDRIEDSGNSLPTRFIKVEEARGARGHGRATCARGGKAGGSSS